MNGALQCNSHSLRSQNVKAWKADTALCPLFYTSVKFLKVFKHEIFGSVTFIPSKSFWVGDLRIVFFYFCPDISDFVKILHTQRAIYEDVIFISNRPASNFYRTNQIWMQSNMWLLTAVLCLKKLTKTLRLFLPFLLALK